MTDIILEAIRAIRSCTFGQCSDCKVGVSRVRISPIRAVWRQENVFHNLWAFRIKLYNGVHNTPCERDMFEQSRPTS